MGNITNANTHEQSFQDVKKFIQIYDKNGPRCSSTCQNLAKDFGEETKAVREGTRGKEKRSQDDC